MDTTNNPFDLYPSQAQDTDTVDQKQPKYLVGFNKSKLSNMKICGKGRIKKVVTFAEFRIRKNLALEKPIELPQNIEHDVSEFFSFCCCFNCLEYREVMLSVMTNHILTASVWIDLKAAVEKCYEQILRTFSPKSRAMFKTLTTDRTICWAIGDSLKNKKHNQLEVISKLRIEGKLNFLVLGTILQLEDGHQLFELLSYIAECFAKSFSEGFNDILERAPEGHLPAKEMVTYMLNGYIATVTECKAMGNYLFAFENSHLRKFNLTWDWLNRRMYKEYVYLPYADRMVDCIIKLKDIISDQTDDIIKMYIKFDEQMTIVDENWRNIWVSLNRYNRSEEEKERRRRLSEINRFFRSICEDQFLFKNAKSVDVDQWGNDVERYLVWNSLVRYCRILWPQKNVLGINPISCEIKCEDCNDLVEYHKNGCKCVSCSIAGAPSSLSKAVGSDSRNVCLKCSIYKKEKNGFLFESNILNQCSNNDKNKPAQMIDTFKEPSKENENVNTGLKKKCCAYHISWALFKHLPERKPYPYPTIEEKYFCKNCENPSCFLAIKILNDEFQLSLSEYLIENYNPMFVKNANIFEMIPPILRNMKKLCEFRKNEGLIDDNLEKILFSFVLSVLACYFSQFHDETPMNLKYFELADNDISLISTHKPGNANCDSFCEILPKMMGLFECNMNVSRDVSSDSSPERENGCEIKKILRDMITNISAAEREKQDVKKEQEEPKPKCTENHQNKQVFKKECGHIRVNHTRDRLRKKLSQQVTAKKVAIKQQQQEQLKKILPPPNKLSVDKSLSAKICHEILGGLFKDTNKPKIESPVQPSIETKKLDAKDRNQKRASVASECTASSASDELPLQQNSIKGILRYIESSNKNTVKPINDKKAAKKAKQKLKKEENKRIGELHDYCSQFHDLYFKEFLNKIELKEIKSTKRKEKKKVTELENNIKKLSKAKSRIESNILELIATIKLTNSEFKFSYLPTKEQQQEKLNQMSSKTEIAAPSTTSVQEPEPIVTAPSIPYYPSPATLPVNFGYSSSSNFMSHTQMIYAQPQADDKTDPSKRIVTIRRVNMPNVPEQVTVTEKGESADKDKLLYTLIKGQLMPTNIANYNPIISHKLPPELAYYTSSQPSSIIQIESKPPLEPPKKTKTQLKKERRREIKLQEELAKQSNLMETASSETNKKQKKIEIAKTKCDSKPIKTKEIVNNVNQSITNNVNGELTKNEKAQNKNGPLKTVNHENQDPTKSLVDLKSSENKKKKKNNKSPNLDDSSLGQKSNKSSFQTKDKRVLETQGNTKLKKKVQLKVLDNGQFDNNQFKMLHINDFESEGSVTESEDDVELENMTKSMRLTNEVETVPKTKGRKNSQSTDNNNKNSKNSTKNTKQNNPTNSSTKNISDSQTINQTINTPVKEDTNKKPKKKKKKPNILEQNLKPNQIFTQHDQNPNNFSNPIMTTPSMAFRHHQNSEAGSYAYNANVSIMEQLKRGVQVENLTLPPGITLTKVDPSKAEAIRIRNESIGRLSQPLQQQNHMTNTISSMHSPQFFPQNGPYGGNQSGVIMVETMANRNKNPNSIIPVATNSGDNTKSKKKRRKNKKIPDIHSTNKIPQLLTQKQNQISNEPKMVTLRNPMFHGVVSRETTNYLAPPPIPIDQPAAIIKNDNGMFTIRNPALHQAVTNGGIYPNQTKQFTPQYYAPPPAPIQPFRPSEPPFTYFSSDNSTQNGDNSKTENFQSYNGKESNKLISAIGSEIKKKQASQWLLNSDKVSPRQSSGAFDFSEVEQSLPSSSWMKEKQQQSNYNSFEIFPQNSKSANCNSGIFENMQGQHSCDDSPPPSITGYNRYLDDIPNTGIIRYNNASFLKTLMPGQKLNNEVTIHNVSESNYRKNNNTSPIPHRVDITRITNNNKSTEDDEKPNTQGLVNQFHDETALNNSGETEFAGASNFSSSDVDLFKQFNYDYKQSTDNQSLTLNYLNGNRSGNSSHSSPFLDDELFVQNLSSLMITDDDNSPIQSSMGRSSPSKWWQ